MALEQFKIELVIRKKQIDMLSVPVGLMDVINEYKVIENDSRLVVDLPLDWDGFRNGMIIEMHRHFNESVYAGIAYFTDDVDAMVTNFRGEGIDLTEETVDGVIMNKYVGKRIRIVKVLDKILGKFDVKAYILDLKFVDPIIKVLDVYSYGKESLFTLSNFNIKVNE
jgi:hypothetical protein